MKIAFTGTIFFNQKIGGTNRSRLFNRENCAKKPQKFIKRFYKFRNRKIVLF